VFALLALSLATGVLAGYLRGGRVRELAFLNVRWSPLLVAAVVLRLLLSPESWQLQLGLARWGDQLYVLCDVLVVSFLLANVNLPGFGFLAVGQASNLLVKLLNGWKMPVDPVAAERLGYVAEAQTLQAQGIWLHSRFIDSQTKLPFLGDVIYVGPPFPWPRLFSVGDLLLLLGVVVCVQGLMLGDRKARQFRATRGGRQYGEPAR